MNKACQWRDDLDPNQSIGVGQLGMNTSAHNIVEIIWRSPRIGNTLDKSVK